MTSSERSERGSLTQHSAASDPWHLCVAVQPRECVQQMRSQDTDATVCERGLHTPRQGMHTLAEDAPRSAARVESATRVPEEVKCSKGGACGCGRGSDCRLAECIRWQERRRSAGSWERKMGNPGDARRLGGSDGWRRTAIGCDCTAARWDPSTRHRRRATVAGSTHHEARGTREERERAVSPSKGEQPSPLTTQISTQ